VVFTGNLYNFRTGFQVLIAVVMKSTIFGIWRRAVCWVSTDVSEEHIASIFRVEKISWARNQHESRWQAHVCLAHVLTLVSCSAYVLDPEDGGDMFLRNVGWYSTDYMTLYPRRWYSSALGLTVLTNNIRDLGTWHFVWRLINTPLLFVWYMCNVYINIQIRMVWNF
jgi:hypothetical protein